MKKMMKIENIKYVEWYKKNKEGGCNNGKCKY